MAWRTSSNCKRSIWSPNANSAGGATWLRRGRGIYTSQRRSPHSFSRSLRLSPALLALRPACRVHHSAWGYWQLILHEVGVGMGVRVGRMSMCAAIQLSSLVVRGWGGMLGVSCHPGSMGNWVDAGLGCHLTHICMLIRLDANSTGADMPNTQKRMCPPTSPQPTGRKQHTKHTQGPTTTLASAPQVRLDALHSIPAGVCRGGLGMQWEGLQEGWKGGGGSGKSTSLAKNPKNPKP